MSYQIVRRVSFRGELRQRVIDVAGNVLHIGRGTSNDLQLEDLAVSLTHASITREADGDYVLRDLTRVQATYLNGSPTINARLRDGDTLRIQHYLLSISLADDPSPLVVTVEEQSRSLSESIPEMMPRLRLSSGRWTKKALATVLTLLIVGGATLAVGMRKSEIFMPGSVSLKHAKFSNQCEKCHATWKAVWNAVPNETCQTCHSKDLLTPSHFGDRSLTPAPLCATCHLEHKGLASLASVPDAQCVRCHGDLKARDSAVPVTTAVHSFTKDHPEFAVSRSLPGQAAPIRVRLNDKDLLKDDAKLKLNHALHLEAELPSLLGKETLTCVSCHRSEKEGRYMEPIKFQRDCQRCHAITFGDPLLPDRSVTHGRSQAEVREELQQMYAGLYLRMFPEEAKKPLGTKRLPGELPKAQEKYIDERTARAERVLFPPQGKVCLKCHFAEDGTNKMVKVGVPEQWLPYSRFDHTPHFALSEIKSKGNVCLACHENAQTSKKTEDVLLPSIGLCRTCHAESGGAQASCKSCHVFHPQLQRPKSPHPSNGLTSGSIISFLSLEKYARGPREEN